LAADNSGDENSNSHRKKALSDESSEEDFKYYSKDEFLEKQKSTTSLSGLPTNASSTPVAKPVKVVNLIDFSDTTQIRPASPRLAPGLSGSASPRLGGLGGSSPRVGGLSPHNLPMHPPGLGLGSTTPGHLSLPLTALHLRQSGSQSPRDTIEHQVQLMTKELQDKSAEIEILRRRLAEIEAVADKNKEESRKLLDQLDAATRANGSTVQELRDQLMTVEQKEAFARAELDLKDDQLEKLVEESTQLRHTVQELAHQLAQSQERETLRAAGENNAEIMVKAYEARIAELEANLETARISAENGDQAVAEQLETARGLEKQLEELRVQLETANGFEIEASELRAQLQTARHLEQESAEMRSQLETARGFENEVHELRAQLVSARANESEMIDLHKAGNNRILELEALLQQHVTCARSAEDLASKLQSQLTSGQEHMAEVEQQLMEKSNALASLLGDQSTSAVQAAERISELEGQLTEANETLAKLCDIEAQMQKSNTLHETESLQLKSRIEELETQLCVSSDQGSHVESLKQLLEQREARISEIEAQLASIQASIEQRDAYIGELEQRLSSDNDQLLVAQNARMQLESVQSDLAQRDSRIHELEAGIEKKTEELQILQSELTIREEQLVHTEERLAQASEFQEAIIDKEATILSLQRSITVFNEQISELSLSITRKDEEIELLSAAKQANVQAHEHIARLEAELEAALNEGEDKQYMSDQLAEVQSRLVSLQGERETLAMQLGEVQARLVSVEEEREATVAQLGGDLNVEHQRCAQLEDQLRYTSAELEQLKTGMDEFTRTADKTTQQNVELENDKRSLQAEIVRLSDKISLIESASTESFEEFEAKMAEVRRQNADLAQQLEEKRVNFDALSNDSNTQRATIESLQSELSSVKTHLYTAEMHLTSAQLRVEEEANLRAQNEETRASIEASSQRSVEEIAQLRATIGELRNQLDEIRVEKEYAVSESRELAVKIVAIESSNATAKEEIETLRDSVKNAENELRFVRSELNAESDISRVEVVRMSTELEALAGKLNEAQSELEREVQNGVSTQARIMQSEHVIEELKSKLNSAQSELNNVIKNTASVESVSRQSEQYLKAIQDVSFVMKTVTDKFLSPNASEANSRAVSVEEEGTEAVNQLERSVKSLLRLVEAVSDKSKILEKENLGLENKLRDYENINTALREKANQSFVQRLIDPIVSCKWPAASNRARMGHDGVPVQPRHGSEMSQLIAPPRQYGGMPV
jgi:chromosome segregation ATPase